MKKLVILFSLIIFCVIPLVQGNSQEEEKDKEEIVHDDPKKETGDKKKAKIFKLGDMVVTGTKTRRKLGDVPATISVLNSEDIEKSAITTLDDAMKYTPGLQVWRGRGMASDMTFISIRGMGYGRTLYYVDGINYVDSFGGNPNLTFLPMKNIESIEILRGPYSALYGGRAIGGVVNITTKKPKDGWHASAAGEYGGYNYYRIPATVSWGGKKFAFIINASYKHIDNYLTRKQVPEREFDRKSKITLTNYEINYDEGNVGWQNWNKAYTQRSITTKFYFTPKRGSKHILTAGYKDDDAGTGYTRRYLNINGYSNIKMNTKKVTIFAGLSGEQKLPWKMKLDYRLSFHNPQSKPNAENMNLTIPMPDQSYTVNAQQTIITPIFYLSVGSLGSRDYEAEIRVSRPFTLLGAHNITLGYEFALNEIYENIKEYYTKVNLTDPMSMYLYQNSVFIQDEWQIMDRLLVTAGVRADFFSRYKYEVSPKAGVLFDIHKKTKTQVFGSFATAYNPPANYLKFMPPSPANYLKFTPPWCKRTFAVRYRNPGIQPERALGGEIGIRSSIKEMIYGSISGFWTEVRDYIGTFSGYQNLGAPHVQTIAPFGTVQGKLRYEYPYNRDRATMRGVEVETEIKFLKYHKAFANYTYLNAKDASSSLSNKYMNYGRSGWRLEGVARHLFNFGYKLNWPIHKKFSYWLTAKARFVDKRWTNEWVSNHRKWVNLNGIVVVDLSSGVDIFKHGQIYFHITNLLDIKYKEFAYIMYMPGRQWWCGVKFYI